MLLFLNLCLNMELLKKVIINEYLLASEHFLEKIQTGYLNAILDKIAKELRKDE